MIEYPPGRPAVVYRHGLSRQTERGEFRPQRLLVDARRLDGIEDAGLGGRGQLDLAAGLEGDPAAAGEPAPGDLAHLAGPGARCHVAVSVDRPLKFQADPLLGGREHGRAQLLRGSGGQRAAGMRHGGRVLPTGRTLAPK